MTGQITVTEWGGEFPSDEDVDAAMRETAEELMAVLEAFWQEMREGMIGG